MAAHEEEQIAAHRASGKECSEGRRKIPARIVSPVQSRARLMKIALEMQD